MGVKFLVGARVGTSGRRIEMGALRVHITGAPLSLPPFSLLSLAAALHQPRHIKLAVSPLLPQAEDGGQSLGGRQGWWRMKEYIRKSVDKLQTICKI